MSPFNMHYNVYEMIELKQKSQILSNFVRNLVFRTYKKTDASIDWTLLKITFQDITLLQQIADHIGDLVSVNFMEWQKRRVASYDSQSEDSDYSHSSNEEVRFTLEQNFKKISEESSQGDGSVIQDSEKSKQQETNSEDDNSDEDRSQSLSSNSQSKEKRHPKMENKNPTPVIKRNSIIDTIRLFQYSTQNAQLAVPKSRSNFRERRPVFGQESQNPFYFQVLNPIPSPNTQRRSLFVEEEEIKENSQSQNSKNSTDSFDISSSEMAEEIQGIESKNRVMAHKVTKTLSQHTDTQLFDASSINQNSSVNASMTNGCYENSISLDRVKLRAVPREDISKYSDKDLTKVIYQEPGQDCMQIVSFGVQLLLINDNKENFLPVLGVQLSEFLYSFGMKNNVKVGKTQISLQFSYYNALAGNWEPALEKSSLSLNFLVYQNGQRDIGVQLEKEININLSESLLKTIHDTTKSLKQEQAEYESESSSAFKSKKETPLKASKGQTQGHLIDFQEVEGEKGSSRVASESEIIVSPYAICNLTEADIVIEKEVTQAQYQNMLKKMEKRETSRRETVNYQISDSSASLIMNDKLLRRTGTSTRQINTNQPKSDSLLKQTTLGKSPQTTNKDITSIAVLKVAPGQTQNYAVDYEKVIKQQIDQYRELNQKSEEIINVSFCRKSKIPIQGVNLNKTGQASRHYFPNSKFKEFLLYFVSFKHLKRVLTIRTQYIIHNQTLENYSIRIINLFDKQYFQLRTLNSGELLPIPESYNQSIIQIKLSSEDDSSWSDEWHIYALKHIVKPNCPGHLKHGETFTFFRKVENDHPQTFNINLMPPLVLKNCLPCSIFFQFVDSNNVLCKITLEKEEVRDIFQFDLQQEIKLQISIPGYKSGVLKLDNTVELLEEVRDKVLLTDFEDHKVQIFYTKSSKSAGFKLTFFVTNCIINQTDQNINLFYEKPSKEFDLTSSDQQNLVSIPYDILRNSQNVLKGIDKLYLLSPVREVWAKFEAGTDISSEINTFTPGTNEKFQLVKKNRIYEFGYSTEVYLANKMEFIYTKITTISSLYVVVNYTKSTVLFAQQAARNIPMFVKPNQHLPFHWTDRESEKLVCVRVIPSKNDKDYSEDFDWSSGITLQDCGSIIVCNRQITERLSLGRGQYSSGGLSKQVSQEVTQSPQSFQPVSKRSKRFLRINRKYHKHQMYIIIEEEDQELPNMLIENLCSNTSVRCQQVGNINPSEIDNVNPQSQQPFCWTDHKGPKQLQIQFYEGIQQGSATLRFPIDNGIKQESMNVVLEEINFEKREVVFYHENLLPQERVFYTVTTNGYTKILRFDNKPPVFVKNQVQEEKSEIVSNTSGGLDHLTKFDLIIPQINFSLLTKKCELLTMYLKGIHAKVESTQMRTKVNFNLKEFQIDNQSELDPIYPVMLKAKKEVSVRTQHGQTVASTQAQDLFQLTIDMRKDVENVQYFDLVQFLLQHLELKLELSHLVLLAEFGTRVGKMFKRNINKQHRVFQTLKEEFQEQILQSSSLQEEAKNQEREQDYLDRQKLVAKNRKMSIAIIKRQQTLTASNATVRKEEPKNTASGVKLKKKKTHDEDESPVALPTIQNRVYIKEYIGSPLKITISLIKHGVTLNDESNELTLFKTISSLGLSISTFENAPIILNALKIKNIFGDKEEVTEQLKGYYLQTIKWNTLSFLGASNLIGNPISLINTLGTGVEEFFYEPYQGFMRGGAAEGALGIVSGTGSLFKNTSLGLVGSLGKIGSSISAGILSITGDEEFIQRRNMGMIRFKPRGVMQGLEQGISSALQSGWSGLKGVVDKPNEGFMKSGAQGFFKGALQGAAGLFVKPITGAMDLVVKTSEGIENSSKSPQEFQTDDRMRQPRAFYEAEHIIRDYDVVHAKILSIAPHLQFYQPDSDRNGQLFSQIDTSIFYGAWILEESNDGYWHILLLVKDQIVRIKRFSNRECLTEEQKTNERLRKQGQSLIQIVSINKISELKQIERYELMLDLDFEDGREILEIADDRTANLVFQKIKSLHKENQKAKRIKQMQQLHNFQTSMQSSQHRQTDNRKNKQ